MYNLLMKIVVIVLSIILFDQIVDLLNARDTFLNIMGVLFSLVLIIVNVKLIRFINKKVKN